MRALWILGCSALLALAVAPASAQPVVAAKSGTISVADGKVFLDANLLDIQPGQFPDMKEKSVLRTEDGRAEVLLPPGMFLRVGENASFRLVSNRLVDTRVELLSGSGVVEIDSANKDAQVTMLLKDGTVTFTKGVYRFDSDPPRLKVFDGNAAVEIGGQSQAVPTGKMIGLASDSASVERFDIRDTDSLDHWSRRRGEELAMANVSSARRAQGNTWSSAVNPCVGTGMGSYGAGPYGGIGIGRSYALGNPDSGVWAYNPWYGMYTYMPCNGMFMSPYGYGFYSPYAIGRMYYNPGSFFGRGGGLASGGAVAARGLTGGTAAPTRSGVGFGSVGSVSHGYSGVVAASSAGGGSSGASGAAAASGGHSSGGGAGGASSGGFGGGGHGGGAAGGGHGR